ncbi:MAG TPA: hypothetical protein VMU78_07685 [Methylocella sp.]|nr:hypothetical protein [Methylocella sp.]
MSAISCSLPPSSPWNFIENDYAGFFICLAPNELGVLVAGADRMQHMTWMLGVGLKELLEHRLLVDVVPIDSAMAV